MAAGRGWSNDAVSLAPRSGRGRAVAAAVALAVAAAVVLVVVLASGGEGGCSSTGYPSSPECVAREYVTRTDGSKCDFVATELLEQLTGARGPLARERCARFAAARPAPRDVRVIERERAGDTVVVELLTDGREGSMTFREQDGRWRIVSFAE